MLRRRRKHSAVAPLGGIELTLLVCLQSVREKSIRREGRTALYTALRADRAALHIDGAALHVDRAALHADRAVTMLVALSTSTRAGIVAARYWSERSIGLRLREQRADFDTRRIDRQDAFCDRCRGRPLPHRYTVAQQLQELRRASDRVVETAREPCELVPWHDAAEVEEAMKAERPANRVRGFKCEAIGESLVGETMP